MACRLNKVTVIIPMYNVSSYVDECFNNLKLQTLHDYEVIIVDDCSTDDTYQRVLDLIELFPREDVEFHLIRHTVNKGVSSARNCGLNNASGEYVYFYDADDRIEPDTLSILYSEAKTKDADIVGCEWFLSFSKNERHIKQYGVSSGQDLFKGFAAGVIRWNLWLFLVKRSLYDGYALRFLPGINMGEDMMIMMLLALVSNRVSIVHQPLYHYVQTNESAQTKNWTRPKREQLTRNVREVEIFCRKLNGNALDMELDFLKQSIKLPFIISDKEEDYKIWSDWFPESDKSIVRNKKLPFRTRLLQLAASKKQYWILKLYYCLIFKSVYGILYK